MRPDQLPGAPGGAAPGTVRRAFRRVFANRRTGRITIAQWPNIPLWVFIVVAVITRVVHPSGSAATVTRTVAVVAVLAWALDEVLRGVNPFRRALGLVVVVVTLVSVAR
jgi:hypothetical protein